MSYLYREKMDWNRLYPAFPSIIFYIICLTLNPYHSDETRNVYSISWLIFNFNPYSFMHLILGGFFFFVSVGNLTWLANPCIFLCWRAIYKENRKKSVKYSSIAVFLIIFLFMYREVQYPLTYHFDVKITRYDLGYWLWLASAIAAFVAAIRMKPAEEPDLTD